METIIPSDNTTKEELQERINYMVNEASRLEKLARTDEVKGMNGFRVLKNFANKECHVLNLQKNEETVNKNPYLSSYQRFFNHLHFTSGKTHLRLLYWNLDEFHQANRGFKL